ncbi:MAG: phosphoglucomutase (alpha-D-glucose-1,6-bisphosphate-dependent) [Lysobacterales bacterium]
MTTELSPLAGQSAAQLPLLDVAALLTAYSDLKPDPSEATQRVSFGTSGHRGRALSRSFNDWHVRAIAQAVCEYRSAQGIDGPLFIGCDTHALSQPAFESVLGVLAGNGVHAMISLGGEYTPTPAVSHAILTHNRDRTRGLADGLVITPSHNPPEYGGIKYNPTDGGPAGTAITRWIETRANALLQAGLAGVRSLSFAQALAADTTHRHDYLGLYVADLSAVLDLEVIAAAGLNVGVDPLGGAGLHYWPRIAETYGLKLKLVSEELDPTFAFMSLDWDGAIRMDPSSAHAMQRLLGMSADFDIAFACDTDYDRHGIVTPSAGLLPSNHYLCVAIDYLFRHRSGWSASAAIGKTVVSSALIDRVAARLGRGLYEVPAGFKWFAEGLHRGELGFAGEESAGATFLRKDGSAWTTDKDGITAALLSAEITARCGRDPGELYRSLTDELGVPLSRRVEAAASASQRARLGSLRAADLSSRALAGDPILQILDRAPGNDAALGGIKVLTAQGWFAARPSGTEDIYKIYAESFRDEKHLDAIVQQAQQVVDAAIA